MVKITIIFILQVRLKCAYSIQRTLFFCSCLQTTKKYGKIIADSTTILPRHTER